MKKAIAGMMAAVVMFFCMIGVAGAAETSGKMYKAVDEQTNDQNYDYDKGSLKLTHVKTANLSKSLDNVSKLKMAVAEYKTVRQSIFFTTHKDVVYYDPDAGEVVPESTAAQAKEAKAYSDKYSDVTGENMHISIIMGLLFLLLLVPAFFIYIWTKRQHTVLTYQLENNLLEGVGDPKYK